jgi:hypothetical protein
MKRAVSLVVAAAFAAAGLAAVAAENKPAMEKQKPQAAAQKPATAEKAKQAMSPSAKTDQKADAKPAAQPTAK